jgi:hypothetical protein
MPGIGSPEPLEAPESPDQTLRLLRYYQRVAVVLASSGLIKGALFLGLQPTEEVAHWMNIGQLALCAIAAIWIAAPYRRRIRRTLAKTFAIFPEKA